MYKKIKKNDQIGEMMEKSHQRIRIDTKSEMDNYSYKKQYLKLRTQQMGSMQLNKAGHRLNKLEDNSEEHIQDKVHRDKMTERTKNKSITNV